MGKPITQFCGVCRTRKPIASIGTRQMCDDCQAAGKRGVASSRKVNQRRRKAKQGKLQVRSVVSGGLPGTGGRR